MIQLITYPDSMGKNLKGLHSILNEHFADVISGVHILPFYPSSADRGFAPLTHLEVDPAFGDWADIRALAEDYEVTSDLIVNHISSKSAIFKDYLAHGSESEYAGYFITPRKFSRRLFPQKSRSGAVISTLDDMANALRRFDHVFHIDGINKKVLQKIYRPRPGTPFVKFKRKDGKTQDFWCTFSRDQIDLDIYNKNVYKMMESYIQNLAKNGVTSVRLDAVGYAVKKYATTNFMIPETYKFITRLAKVAHENHMTTLPEVHGHYSHQVRLAQIDGVDHVYDFQLPIIAIHTLFTCNTMALARWIRKRPENIITTLDTHDGLPIVDVADLLTKKETDAVVDYIKENGGSAAMRASGDGANNVDVYQVNCTYYSALNKDNDAYIAARALQCFLPGIPQIYYVGLFAGKNDKKLLEKTQNGRDINRHPYTKAEVRKELDRPIVKRLVRILRLRNTHPAFDGKFSFTNTPHTITLSWNHGISTCRVIINVSKKTTRITYSDPCTNKNQEFVA